MQCCISFTCQVSLAVCGVDRFGSAVIFSWCVCRCNRTTPTLAATITCTKHSPGSHAAYRAVPAAGAEARIAAERRQQTKRNPLHGSLPRSALPAALLSQPPRWLDAKRPVAVAVARLGQSLKPPMSLCPLLSPGCCSTHTFNHSIKKMRGPTKLSATQCFQGMPAATRLYFNRKGWWLFSSLHLQSRKAHCCINSWKCHGKGR